MTHPLPLSDGVPVLGGAVVLLAVLAAARSAIRRHGLGAVTWRWLTGHHLDGQHRTNASWTRPATKALTPTGHASRWAHQPRLVRAAWRTSGTLAALLAAAGMLTAPRVTIAALGALAAAALALAAWRAWRAIAAWQHVRRWVRPLHAALAVPLGVPSATRPQAWITIPRKFAALENARIRLDLPEGFAPGGEASKSAITAVVAAKLALESPAATWHLAGHRPHVTYTVEVPPPDRVAYADVRQLIAEASDSAPIIGLGRARRPVHVDLDLDSPHAIFSMASGTGKSVVLRTLIAQQLARGAVALILDIKRLSHAWARGLPNVWYCRDIGEIHDAALWLAAETDKRNRVADEGADIDGNTDHVDVGPRLLVVGEELNATSVRLVSHWRRIKDKDDPNMSPAIEGLGDVFFMGRQVKINILAVAQMFTARTVGGPEARENAGVRCLAGYTANNWRMLVPEIPMPPKSRVKGRIQVCVAGQARETQVAYLTPAEARELATSGTVARFPREQLAEARETMRPAAIRLRLADEPIGLRQAVADGVIPVSLDAARSARARDPEFPQPRAEGRGGEQLYDRGELAAWARNRPRATGTDGE